VPIGAFAVTEGDTVTLTGLIASVDGKEILKEEATAPAADAAKIGTALAEKLLKQGGRAILDEVYGS